MTEKPTIDDYISSQPGEVQEILTEIRRVIHSAVPGAGERISYQMPTITLDGSSLVHFAAWKRHIGLYPLPPADEAFAAELAPYDTGKGTARFSLDQPMPYDLIARIADRLAKQREPGTDQ